MSSPTSTRLVPWQKLREEVLDRDGHRCQRCDHADVLLQAHHLVPRDRGGKNKLSNLIALCVLCHDWVEIHLDAMPTLNTRTGIIGSFPVDELELESVEEPTSTEPYGPLSRHFDELVRLSTQAPEQVSPVEVASSDERSYEPSSYCTTCGRDFANDALFDRHRVGKHEHVWSLEHPDGRRCMDVDEMLSAGLRPLSEVEMESTQRHRHRVGFGIEMWVDPDKLRMARERLTGSVGATARA